MAIRISVVVPTYRRTALLYRCVKVLLEQDLDKDLYEIIVVSDGPDGPTQHLMRLVKLNYQGRHIHFYATERREGPAAARNLGWRSAAGELIVFTDDDCLPARDCLFKYWQAYQQKYNSEAAFKGSVRVPLNKTPTDFEKNMARLQHAEFVTANCACTKQALQQAGGFDENFKMAWREDSDLQFKLIEAGIPIVEVPEAVVIHPVKKAGWGVSIHEQKKSMYNALLYKKYPRLYRQKITGGPLWNYYTMLILWLAGVTALFSGSKISIVFLAAWLVLVTRFAAKRLAGTLHTPVHIAEMMYTSAIIPVLSIYWTLYGSIKFKKLLL